MKLNAIASMLSSLIMFIGLILFMFGIDLDLLPFIVVGYFGIVNNTIWQNQTGGRIK